MCSWKFLHPYQIYIEIELIGKPTSYLQATEANIEMCLYVWLSNWERGSWANNRFATIFINHNSNNEVSISTSNDSKLNVTSATQFILIFGKMVHHNKGCQPLYTRGTFKRTRPTVSNMLKCFSYFMQLYLCSATIRVRLVQKIGPWIFCPRLAPRNTLHKYIFECTLYYSLKPLHAPFNPNQASMLMHLPCDCACGLDSNINLNILKVEKGL